MVVATGGGWMRFKWASHFLSTEHAVWFRKESFYTLASFQVRMGKESEVQKATDPGFVYISFPREPPAELGLLAFSSCCGHPKQLSYGNG